MSHNVWWWDNQCTTQQNALALIQLCRNLSVVFWEMYMCVCGCGCVHVNTTWGISPTYNSIKCFNMVSMYPSKLNFIGFCNWTWLSSVLCEFHWTNIVSLFLVLIPIILLRHIFHWTIVKQCLKKSHSIWNDINFVLLFLLLNFPVT